ncbi:SRPBCC family protein [Pseudorhodoferax sp.]|uniref:SRPBCC family protein n=1 Tax=Pseudorhodoferax sp. TaxID=1993553 RepID=UPI002DD61AFB|nr:SRPBCC family protein [Pseudorhodoferax sp.]
MAHRRLEFTMPAPAEVVFDAFHYHRWRVHWDSLVSRTQVQGGAPCPSVGAVSQNTGGGLLRGLSMTTRFVSYAPPALAAASMVGQSFPFARWAASMRHRPLPDGRSVLVYTYSFSVTPAALAWLLEPVVDRIFLRATRKRFARLQKFLAVHGAAVQDWRVRHKPG